MEEKVNVAELEKNNEGSKASRVLSIVGTIFLVITIVLCASFLSLAFPFFMGKEDLGSAFGIVIGIVYFLIPGVIASIVSSVLNGLAWKKSNEGRGKVYKLVTFILSLVALIVFIASFVYILIK